MFDGYHIIRTSETELADQQILDRYHQLWRIEQTFRVTKTDLQARGTLDQAPPEDPVRSSLTGRSRYRFNAYRILRNWMGPTTRVP